MLLPRTPYACASPFRTRVWPSSGVVRSPGFAPVKELWSSFLNVVPPCSIVAWVGIEGNGEYLSHAREFAPDKPARARSDMALHAFHARVRRILVRGKLG